MNARQRHALLARLREANPDPRGELEYGSPFQLLVAVILSAQATDRSVNKATAGLFAAAPDAESMLRLGEEGVSSHIRSIGLYRTKARNVIATCQLLIERHGGEVPRDRAALEALPGVGRKTANVVLNIAFDEPVIAVDTHVFRVANRTGLAPGRNVREVEMRLLREVPQEFMRHAHHWLILHGRYVCLARQPRCPSCIINDLCEHPYKTPGKRTADAEKTVPAASSKGSGKNVVRSG
jgi:endonuclease-3